MKKKKLTKDQQIKNLKHDRLVLIIGFSLIFLLCLFVLTHPYFLPFSPNNFDKNTTMLERVDVNTTNLTEEHIQEIEEILLNTKPEYLVNQYSITFAYDINRSIDGSKKAGTNRWGPKGSIIYVKFYPERKKRTMEVLCHELLHTHLLRNDEAHKIVYDLAEQLPCFYADRRIELDLTNQY